MVWTLYLLILIKHRSNIYRLFHHQENKVGFKHKLEKVFCKNNEEETQNKEKAEQITVVEEKNIEKTGENDNKIEENNENNDNKV